MGQRSTHQPERCRSLAGLLKPAQPSPDRGGAGAAAQERRQCRREAGFAAVGVSEEFTGGDTTPHYHAATDTAATLHLPFVALGARLVALVIAREVGAP